VSGPRDKTLAMVMCARNESRFLAANLLYHHALGVRKCYLFLDRCTDDTSDIAAAFAWVERIEIDPADSSRLPYITDLSVACMDRALQLARRDGFEWLMVLDPDEFAFADLPPQRGVSAREAGDLTRLVSQVSRRVDMIRLRTQEVVTPLDDEDMPFWKQHYFLTDIPFDRRFFDPVSREEFCWRGPIGHSEGQCIVRTAAKVQAYDSHRWVADQNRIFPARPAHLPVKTVDGGIHFHFLITGHNHWLEKYRKLSGEPEVWPCGTSVELPKQCWKRATTALPPDELRGYFQRWISMPTAELQRLAHRGMVEERHEVERVLSETGAIDSLGQRVSITEHAGTPPPACRWNLPGEYWCGQKGKVEGPDTVSFAVADVDPQRLSNFYGVERHQRVYFRWARPKVELTLPLTPDDYELRVDSRHLWRRWGGRMRAVINGKTVPAESRRNYRGIVSLRIGRDVFDARGEQHILLLFDVLPEGSHPGDTRSLGAPIVNVSFKLTGTDS